MSSRNFAANVGEDVDGQERKETERQAGYSYFREAEYQREGKMTVDEQMRQAMFGLVCGARNENIRMLNPDEYGALENIDRIEAKKRGLPVYVGRLSSIDKPFPIQGTD